jgi:Spy/CpxP family protein refolding chaperone
MKQELGLSDQQLGQLQKLRLESRKSGIRRRADTQLARLNLREQLQAQSVDEKAVQARVKELSDLQAANLRARVDARLAMRKILTPEQQAKLRQLRAERPRMRERLDGQQGPPERAPRPPRPGPRRGGGGDGDGRDALTGPDVR